MNLLKQGLLLLGMLGGLVTEPLSSRAKLVTRTEFARGQLPRMTQWSQFQSADRTTDRAPLAVGQVWTPATQRWQQTTITYRLAPMSAYYRQIWRSAARHWSRVSLINLVETKAKSADITVQTKKQPAHVAPSIVGMMTSRHYSRTKLANLNVLATATATLYRYTTKALRYTRLQRIHVAEHEFGHTLGLQHAPFQQSVMYYVTRDRTITVADIRGIQRAYAN